MGRDSRQSTVWDEYVRLQIAKFECMLVFRCGGLYTPPRITLCLICFSFPPEITLFVSLFTQRSLRLCSAPPLPSKHLEENSKDLDAHFYINGMLSPLHFSSLLVSCSFLDPFNFYLLDSIFTLIDGLCIFPIYELHNLWDLWD